jgi:hypothetical protein
MTVKARQDGTTTASMAWLDYTVWTVALWASFLNLLNFNDYPLLRAEVGVTMFGLAFLGLLMGVVQRVARPRLTFLVAALFAAVAIDLNTSIELSWFYVLWVGLAVVAFFALDGLLKIVLAASTAVFLFQLVALLTPNGPSSANENETQNPQTASMPVAERPAIVHLVLDSYLGLDGMALGPAAYRDLRAEQAAFFIGQAFQTYPRAYSRHSRTTDSLPRMFSYGKDGPGNQKITPYHIVPGPLPYFADLDERGYRIKAVLPAYFDLCAKQKLTHCHKWESSDLTSMLGTELDPFDRAKVFGFTLLQLTNAPARVAAAAQYGMNDLLGTEGRWTFNRSQLYHLASIRGFDRFIGELADIRPGEVRFAHVLLPHSPFGLRADCSVKPESAWQNEHGPTSVADREEAYAEQLRCVQRRIARMLDVLQRSQAGREAVVLIHGDHGSRIAPAHPTLDGPELSPREMLMAHSTLFVIRVPGEAARVVKEAHALDELMADFRARDFASAPRPKSAPALILVTDPTRSGVDRQLLPSFDPDLK